MATKIEIKRERLTKYPPEFYQQRMRVPYEPSNDDKMTWVAGFIMVAAFFIIMCAVHLGHQQTMHEHESKALFENSFQNMDPDPEYEQPYYYSEN